MAVVLCLLGTLAGTATWSAFSSTTANSGNSLTSASVTLTDNDSGAAVLSLSSAIPGATDSGCIQVTFSGAIDSVVTMYGTTTGTGLDPYVNLTVTRGTVSSGSFDSCTNFTPDTADYLGSGAGVMYSGTVQAFPDTWAAGITEPEPGIAETWTTNEVHAYKLDVTLQSDNNAQGKNATQTFTWEARNAGCNLVTPYWMTGMEHGAVSSSGGGLFSSLVTTGGTATADTSVVRSGGYSLKIDDSSGANPVQVYTPSLGTSGATGRFAIRFPTLPAADVSTLFGFDLASGGDGYIGFTQSTSKLTVSFGGTGAQSSATAISAGKWYLIDAKVDAASNPRTLDWRINGVGQTQSTRAQTGTTVTQVVMGTVNNSEVTTFYLDDMIVTNSTSAYPIGDGSILGLVPDSVGTVNDPSSRLQDNDSTAVDATSYQRLDELPMTSVADYVKQTAIDVSAYITFGFANTSYSCVNAVRAVSAVHSSSTTANSAKTSVFDSSTESVVRNGDMSPGGALEYYGATVTPDIGKWDQTGLNGLVARAGYASSVGSQPYWDGLMLEFNIGR